MDKLLERKDRIEARIKSIVEELDNLGVGLSRKLVDSEGFPRNDIDIYRVRDLRNEHASLQTDHFNVMKEIEVELPKYFEAKK